MSTQTPSPPSLARKLSQHLEEIDERKASSFGRFDIIDEGTPSNHSESSQSQQQSPNNSRPTTSHLSKSGRPSMDDLTAVNSREAEARADEQMEEKADHLPHHPDNDPDLVEWDCPNDPENPQNFSFTRKVLLTALIIVLTINV